MKKILALTKVMTKDVLNNLLNKQNMLSNNDSKYKRILKLIMVVFLYIYLVGIIVVPSYYVIDNLNKVNQPSLAISIIITFAPLLILYFSILTIPGVFYFSDDIEDYLPLPIKSYEITIAKYLSTYIQLQLSSLMFILPMFIIYFVIVKPGFLFILLSLIVLLFLPLIPISIGLIITAITMRFLPFFKNKNLYMYLTTSLAIIPVFFFIVAMGKQDFDIDPMILILESIQNMDDSIFRQINLFFPTSHMFTIGILDTNIIQLLIASLISLVISISSVFIIQPFYFDSVIGIDESSSKKKALKLTEFDRFSKTKNIKLSFMINDFKRIIRTPILAINYFSIFIIIPISSLLPLLMQGSLSELSKALNEVSIVFHDFFYKLEFLQQLELISLIGVALGLFIANFEMTSSTAITREGKQMKDYLTMPIQLSEIGHAKALFSIIISCVYSLALLIFGIIILKPKIITILLFLVALILGITLTTYISIFVDASFPKLNWDNISEGVKGNFIQVLVILPFMFLPMIFVFMYMHLNIYINLILILLIIPLVVFVLIKQTSVVMNGSLVRKVQNL